MKHLRTVLGGLEKFTGNRWTRLAVSGILIATASVEVVANVSKIGAHHGLLVFGVVNLFRTLPDFFQGVSLFEEAERQRSA